MAWGCKSSAGVGNMIFKEESMNRIVYLILLILLIILYIIK